MSGQSANDPTAELRFAVRIARMVRRTPRVLRIPLQWVAYLAGRIIVPILTRELPEREGFRFWIEGPNADLYQERLTGGLQLLRSVAPAYVRWLKGEITTLEVSVVTRVAAVAWHVDYSTHVASFNPRVLYTQSPEAIAFAIGCVAIRSRLETFGIQPKAVGHQRYYRLLLRRQLQLARSLPRMETEILRLQTEISKQE